MTPLQKIAMGLVIVVLPAYFPAHPHPDWAFYDALPDPLGWALVVAGVWALARASSLDLTAVKWLAVVALVVSVPMWFPQLNHLLAPEFNPDAHVSGQWAVSLPQTLFGLVLARTIGRAGHETGDRYLASRFGVLTWAFALTAVLPIIAYGAPVEGLQQPTALFIGLTNVVFVYYLFASNRRRLLGGPGPRDWAARGRAGNDDGRPPGGERPQSKR